MRKPKVPAGVLGAVLFWFYKALCATLRFREEGRDLMDSLDADGQRTVICLWHDELFPLMHVKRQLDAVTVVSPSKDGEILANVLGKLGLRIARGSSTRGGVGALLKAARMMNSGTVHGCVTVDGPTGPRHKAKDGVFLLAHRANAWIMPVRIVMDQSCKLHSWDRFQVPIPFSKVKILWGTPWKMPEGELDESILAAARERLEQSLDVLCPAGDYS